MSDQFSSVHLAEQNGLNLFAIERTISNSTLTLEEAGKYLPGNLLVTDLNSLSTVYMNECGCNILKHSVEELQELGPEYFGEFFVPEEMQVVIPTYLRMKQEQNASFIYNFAHRVKSKRDDSYKWYLASAKLLYEPGKTQSDKLLVVVNEVNTAGAIANKISRALDEGDWIRRNFAKYCRLSKREKQLLVMFALGKTNADIAGQLGLTILTVNTHRRNIKVKLEVKTFTEMYRFAVGFGITAS